MRKAEAFGKLLAMAADELEKCQGDYHHYCPAEFVFLLRASLTVPPKALDKFVEQAEALLKNRGFPPSKS